MAKLIDLWIKVILSIPYITAAGMASEEWAINRFVAEPAQKFAPKVALWLATTAFWLDAVLALTLVVAGIGAALALWQRINQFEEIMHF